MFPLFANQETTRFKGVVEALLADKDSAYSRLNEALPQPGSKVVMVAADGTREDDLLLYLLAEAGLKHTHFDLFHWYTKGADSKDQFYTDGATKKLQLEKL